METAACKNTTQSRTSVIRTLIQLTIAFCFIFTAYTCLEALQSSLNFEDGLGTACVGVLYGVYAVSSLGPGPALVNKLSPKWAMMCAWFSHTLFVCANFYPAWATLMPGSVVLGFMSSVVWISQGTYFTDMTRQYSTITDQELQTVMGRFSAVLDQAESIAMFAGSGIAAGVLHSQVHDDSLKNVSMVMTNSNESQYADYDNSSSAVSHSRDISVCGPNHCPYLDEHTAVLARPDQTLVYILLGTLLACNLLGILTTCFLSNVEQEKKDMKKCESYMQPLKLFKKRRLYLVIWIFANGNFSRCVYASAFQQSFISCVLGVGMIGYTTLTIAGAGVVTALISGKLIKFVPRLYQYTLGCCLNVVLAFTWLFWHPQADQTGVFFLLAAIHGTADCLFRVHVRSITVDVFDKQTQAGFAQMCAWKAFGGCLAFGLNNVLCLVTKAISVIVIAILAASSLITLEIILRIKQPAAKKTELKVEIEQREQFLHKRTNHSPSPVDGNDTESSL